MTGVFRRVLNSTRGILPVFGIAVGVALLGTATGFAWDKVHRATADALAAQGTPATKGDNGTQVIKLDAWGVTASLPLATELPLLSFVQQTPEVVGLSSADLMKLGGDCQPAKGALGTITRYPAGAYGNSVKALPGANVISTVGPYDFVYQFPQTGCANQASAITTINRETAIVLEGLGSLAATKK